MPINLQTRMVMNLKLAMTILQTCSESIFINQIIQALFCGYSGCLFSYYVMAGYTYMIQK